MGAPRLRHQGFHIPLADHGCKRTQVQNNSESFLWPSQQSFPGKRQAGRHQLDPDWNVLLPFIAFHFPRCLTAQLTGVIGLTLWEAVFRCMSQWSERGEGCNRGAKYEHKRQRRPAFAAPYLQLQLPRKDPSREKVFLH